MVHKTNIYEFKILNSILFFGFAMFLACFADLAYFK